MRVAVLDDYFNKALELGDWSPIDGRIAFRSNILASAGREYDIFTVDVEAGPAAADGYTRITTDGQNNHRPAWSG